MHRQFFIIIFAACTMLYPQNADTTDIYLQARQWFEWGEYLNCIEFIPVALSDTTITNDSSKKAQLHIYLGVAYFSAAEAGMARKEFFNALQLDPEAEPDKTYISDAIFNFFTAAKNEYFQKIEDEKSRQVVLRQKELETETKQATIDSLDMKVKTARNKMYLFSALLTAACSVGFGGAAVYEYYKSDQEYEKFLSAAQIGDYSGYTKHKDAVRTYDGYSLLAGTASVVCIVSSTILSVITHKHRQQCKKNEHIKVSGDYTGNGVQLVITFR